MARPEIIPISNLGARASGSALSIYRKQAAPELVFAVVGHVGSGTTAIAEKLEELLHQQGFDVVFLKATEEILRWARNTRQPESAHIESLDRKDLQRAILLQDLGDAMRFTKKDNAAVARALVIRIRTVRAERLNLALQHGEPVLPDETPRAYILESLRHPFEVELLRHIYGRAFALIGIVCDEEDRLGRLSKKFRNAGRDDAWSFMKRDEKAREKHGQRVGEAFHLADYFLDNTVQRYLSDEKKTPNPDWDIPEQLRRLVRIIAHSDVMRPTTAETAMHMAFAAKLRSACLSRQVGAALVDRNGRIIATGANEVPRAGGGVYGEQFDEEPHDGRCAFRPLGDQEKPYCSNNREQSEIIEDLIREIPELAAITDPERRDRLVAILRGTRIGGLLEFSRAVHAEMDALLAAARLGISTLGTRLFVTTFPCHYCARHLVGAGVDEVQYIEPYPKSRALKLHDDAITKTALGWKPMAQGGPRVLFRPFTGVAPRLYRRAFLKDRDLKDDTSGEMQVGEPTWGSPWYPLRVSYVQLEAELAKEE